MARLALDQWPSLDGYAVAHGVPDLRTLPADRFANFVYWMATRHSDAAGVEKFRARLWRPPAGVAVTDSRSPWSPEAEQGAFAALKSGLGLGGARSPA